MPISQFIPPLLSPLCIHKFVLYVCVSTSIFQIRQSIPFFLDSTYCIVYDICFSLSDLLHSV